jgi:uncharacterized protein DUF2817
MTRAADHFASGFGPSRVKFLDAAAKAGFRVETYRHDAPGMAGEALGTDVARLGAADAPKLLLVTSATHGVEGFCGSGIETAIMAEGLGGELPRDTALLLIHAINPYGFSWLRRVTEENVDLNRNFIDHGRARPENPGYEELANAICPPRWDESARQEAQRRLDDFAARHGKAALQAAITSGQYRHADGVFYGGARPSWSADTLARILARHGGAVREAAFLDIHTGLGPYGHGELISNHGPGTAGLRRLVDWFGARVTSPEGGSSTSAPTTGDISRGVEAALPDATVTAVAIEYGTRPIDQMLDAVRADNWLHVHGRLDSAEGRAIKNEIRDAFYPDEPGWKSMVLERAVEVYRETLAGLGQAD